MPLISGLDDVSEGVQRVAIETHPRVVARAAGVRGSQNTSTPRIGANRNLAGRKGDAGDRIAGPRDKKAEEEVSGSAGNDNEERIMKRECCGRNKRMKEDRSKDPAGESPSLFVDGGTMIYVAVVWFV